MRKYIFGSLIAHYTVSIFIKFNLLKIRVRPRKILISISFKFNTLSLHNIPIFRIKTHLKIPMSFHNPFVLVIILQIISYTVLPLANALKISPVSFLSLILNLLIAPNLCNISWHINKSPHITHAMI